MALAGAAMAALTVSGIWSALAQLSAGPFTQAQVDAGVRSGPSSAELEEIKQLKKENRDLKEANEILKAASIFFARELDPHRH